MQADLFRFDCIGMQYTSFPVTIVLAEMVSPAGGLIVPR